MCIMCLNEKYVGEHVKCEMYTTHKGDIIMKNMSIRKNITIPAEDFELFDRYSKRIGKTFSEFIRIAAKNYIEKLEEDLKSYLLSYCEYVSKEEQRELEKIIKNLEFDSEDCGEEINIHELLQSSLQEKG